ncbi:MAG TPA: outer membrane protein assembly factor BamA [Bacteroidales bacterium]|nr:outer membrane protein assembly factor BamA [Bacteroidales bacterium]
MKKLLFIISSIVSIYIFPNTSISQNSDTINVIKIDYANPIEYEIGGISISGAQFLDNNTLISLSGLTVGDKIKIPGEEITKAIETLWKQGLFEDIKIAATKVYQGIIYLDIYLLEKPRLTSINFFGVKNPEIDKIKEEIKITKGDILTDNAIVNIKNKTLDFVYDKGYMFADVSTNSKLDTAVTNGVILNVNVTKNAKVKINQININGISEVKDAKLKKTMKKTKEKSLLRVFTASRFYEKEFEKDKIKLIDKLNELGYRDAKIAKDSIYKFNDKTINIDITVNQGNKYYFRNINWVGNTKYPAPILNAILKINKGDIYNQKVLDANLYMNTESPDISSLYLDDGYLFFSVTPVETNVENDSIDLEIRIYEGKQAVINKVSISGNTKTNDNVIIREIRTKPGQLFSRSDIIRTQRELVQLKYFNQEKLSVNPIPNAADGTVDIEYVVEEASSDQVELSGGWGAGQIIGTLGLSFNNFSSKNFFKKESWKPLPSGDGQRLSVRAQSNGRYYQSFSASFTEPWLGGKKPNALTGSAYHSIYVANGLSKSDSSRRSIAIDGVSLELGKRLKWPDDFFTLYQGINYQCYTLNNYSLMEITNGKSNSAYYSGIFGRNSIDAPIFPRSGSEISLNVQATLPYSLFSKKDFKSLKPEEKYKWIEYHKWKFSTNFFTKIAGDLVLNTRAKFGFIGYYNKDIGTTPFGRFYLGGDGMSGGGYNQQFTGSDIIGMRGYANNSLTPMDNTGYIGGVIFNKYTMELRYPVSLNPMATIYVLSFVEAGNTWLKFKSFDPFDVKRSAGIGLRMYLPMFGVLGLDWGYGFDKIKGVPSANKGQFHFSINQSID